MISINMSEQSLPREIVVSREVIEALADNGCCPNHDAEIRRKTIDECLSVVEWDGYTLDIKRRIEALKEQNNG